MGRQARDLKDWNGASKPNDFHIGKTKRLVFKGETQNHFLKDTEAKFKVSSESIDKAVGADVPEDQLPLLYSDKYLK